MPDQTRSHRLSQGPIWDLGVRVFHWPLPFLVAGAWWSIETHQLRLHIILGAVILGLMIFRLIWGFLGARTAQWWTLGQSVLGLIRKQPPYVGHSPSGALSVLAMILVMTVQAVTGLFSSDIDGFDGGPLVDKIGFDLSRSLSKLHHLGFKVILVLVTLHVLAIVFYKVFLKKELIRPMISGHGPVPNEARAVVFPNIWRLIVAGILAVALALYLYLGAPGLSF